MKQGIFAKLCSLILFAAVFGGGVTQGNMAAAQNNDGGNSKMFDRISAALNNTFTGLDNGYKLTRTCPVAFSEWSKPFSHNTLTLVRKDMNAVGPELNSAMIMSWYYSGPEAIIEADKSNTYSFAKCFEKGGTCGIAPDSRMAKAFARPWGANEGDVKAIRKYFASPPPAAAIAYASRSLGRCFGDDPAQPSMEALGFVEAKLSQSDCQSLKNYARGTGAPGWGRYFTASLSCESGIYVPKAALDALNRKKAADYRFANRSIADRTAGLNGCQIAYGLVFNGINDRTGQPVGRIPDEAISWALKYEQSVFARELCPPMPKALSDWVMKQPLNKFEPVQDPFVAFANKPPAFGDWYSWSATVMKYYEVANDPQIAVIPESCSDFRGWLTSKWMKQATGGTENRPDRLFLMKHAFGNDIPPQSRAALCQRVPGSMVWQYYGERKIEATKLAQAKAEYERAEARRKEEELRRNAARSTQPSYLWNNKPSEQRCYMTGTTQSGLSVRQCFGG